MIGTPRNFKSISKYKFLFLGRISNQKRLDRAIDFVAYLKCCGLNVTFDIYGIGGYEEKNFLINHIKSKNIDDDVISFYPPVPHENLSSILLNYDFYLQTSQFEGMAMSVTEALQSGLVCLVTPVGEIKYYGIDQNNLLLFNGFNERSFLRLHEALKEPEKLDTISRNAITTFCDESTYNESLVEILNTI
jgi:glycosyltransferase involved in cell wall biosynthesis